MDKDGLTRSYFTLGQIAEAIGMHSEDAVRNTRITDMTGFDQAIQGIEEAQAGLKRVFEQMRDCDICQEMIGDEPRAEVVVKFATDGRHLIIHQSCFTDDFYEIA